MHEGITISSYEYISLYIKKLILSSQHNNLNEQLIAYCGDLICINSLLIIAFSSKIKHAYFVVSIRLDLVK